MSSQKWARLIERIHDDEETGEQVSEHIWRCKIDKDDCAFTSFSNGKPMCEKCPVAKEHKANIKRGKRLMHDILEKKNEQKISND